MVILKIVSPSAIDRKEINLEIEDYEHLGINNILHIVKENVEYACNQGIFVNNIDVNLVKTLSIRENKVEITIFKPNYC